MEPEQTPITTFALLINNHYRISALNYYKRRKTNLRQKISRLADGIDFFWFSLLF